jgi:hypothetical protein
VHADWWKKYSLPSEAATNPKPLSLIKRLTVPFIVAMCCSCARFKLFADRSPRLTIA